LRTMTPARRAMALGALLMPGIRSYMVPCAASRAIRGMCFASRAADTGEEPRLPVVHSSTLAIVPPDEVWEPIQQARKEVRDAGLLRWPPHCNLIYPFVPPKHYGKVLGGFGRALAAVEPFDITLSQFEAFHRKTSSVLWLKPETSVPGVIDEVHRALAEEFSTTNNTPWRGFTPHFTISHFESREACDEAAARLGEWWQPITFHVDQIHVMSRKGPVKPFTLRYRVRLGEPNQDRQIVAAQDGEESYENMPREGDIDTGWSARYRKGLLDRQQRGRRRKSR